MNKIAIAFDFDDTLAEDSTSGFLESMGVDLQDFWKNKVDPLLQDDWDPIPAYLYMMIEESRNGNIAPITKEKLATYGSGINLHNGVPSLFPQLKKHLEDINPQIELEFYLISSGIGEVLRNTRIAKHFTEIWSCEFIYDEEGRIKFPKKIVSFTDKTRYLFHISKGLIGAPYRSRPFDVNKKVPENMLRIPMDQMIFVGDGYTDVPCFSLVKKSGGIPFGVYDKESRSKRSKAWGFIEDGRVSNLLSADFSKQSDLYASLLMGLESIASRIDLKMKMYQG